MRPLAATGPTQRDLERRWPSCAEASTLLLSLEALARWREHLALTQDEDVPESLAYYELGGSKKEAA